MPFGSGTLQVAKHGKLLFRLRKKKAQKLVEVSSSVWPSLQELDYGLFLGSA